MPVTIPPPRDDGRSWWEFTENVATLYRWMKANGHSQEPPPCHFEYYLAKPWAWETEWQEMQNERRAQGVKAAAMRVS